MVRVTPFDVNAWIEEEARRDAGFKQRVEAELAAMRLEQRLIELREARGLSQAQLARILGVSQQAVAKLESGRANPSIQTLVKWVVALGGRLEIAITPKPAPTGRRRRARAP